MAVFISVSNECVLANSSAKRSALTIMGAVLSRWRVCIKHLSYIIIYCYTSIFPPKSISKVTAEEIADSFGKSTIVLLRVAVKIALWRRKLLEWLHLDMTKITSFLQCINLHYVTNSMVSVQSVYSVLNSYSLTVWIKHKSDLLVLVKTVDSYYCHILLRSRPKWQVSGLW